MNQFFIEVIDKIVSHFFYNKCRFVNSYFFSFASFILQVWVSLRVIPISAFNKIVQNTTSFGNSNPMVLIWQFSWGCKVSKY